MRCLKAKGRDRRAAVGIFQGLWRRTRWGGLALACAAWTGCASLSSFQSARTLGHGHWQAGGALGVQGAAGKDVGDGPSARWPLFELSGRYGLTDWLDVGGAASLTGVRAMAKARLYASEGFALSVAPEVGGAVFEEGDERVGQFTASLPLLAGWRLTDSVEAVVGPRLLYLRGFPGSDAPPRDREVFGAGTSLGAVIRVSGWVCLVPEVAALIPFGVHRYQVGDRALPEVGGTQGLFLQAGVGVLVGH